MVIFRRNDGVTDSAEKLVNLPQKKAEKKVTFVEAIDELAPGETGYTVANLGPKALQDRVTISYYEGGHMMYTVKESHQRLKEDMSRFIAGP